MRSQWLKYSNEPPWQNVTKLQNTFKIVTSLSFHFLFAKITSRRIDESEPSCADLRLGWERR